MSEITNHKRFRARFESLSVDVQANARRAFLVWKENPSHPGLRFKPIHPAKPIYSARFGHDWRAVAVKEGDCFVWYWIGSHEEYNALIHQL